MIDKNEPKTSTVWLTIGYHVAMISIAGLIGFVANELWSANTREANVKILSAEIQSLKNTREANVTILSTEIQSLKESMMDQFDSSQKNTNMRFEAAEKNTNMRFEATEKNTNMRFEAAENNADVRFEAAEKNADVRFEAADEKADARYSDFSENNDKRFADFITSVNSLLKVADENTNLRFTEFKDSITAQFTEIIKRIEALEIAIKPSFSDVTKELDEIKSRLINLQDPRLDAKEFNNQLIQVESELEILSQMVELTPAYGK